MKVVTLKQGTVNWRTWRGKGLGASDAPAVMGVSPWTSKFELWLEKTGLGERPPANEYQLAAMRRGNELEPKARARFEDQHGHKFEPLAAEHEEHSFLRASFDGYNHDLNALIEIKAPSKVDHTEALKGKIPKKYYPQLQHQFLVSGALKGWYVSFDGIDSLAVVPVSPDKDYMDKLLSESIAFWTHVMTKTPPEITREDAQKLVESVVKGLEDLNKRVNTLKVLMSGK